MLIFLAIATAIGVVWWMLAKGRDFERRQALRWFNYTDPNEEGSRGRVWQVDFVEMVLSSYSDNPTTYRRECDRYQLRRDSARDWWARTETGEWMPVLPDKALELMEAQYQHFQAGSKRRERSTIGTPVSATTVADARRGDKASASSMSAVPRSATAKTTAELLRARWWLRALALSSGRCPSITNRHGWTLGQANGD